MCELKLNIVQKEQLVFWSPMDFVECTLTGTWLNIKGQGYNILKY